MHLKSKFEGTLIRIKHSVVFLPLRMSRLIAHLVNGIVGKKGQISPDLPMSKAAVWWIELGFLLLDLVAFPEIYETFLDFYKWKTRPLTKAETEMARSVFGNTIHYKRVRVDEKAQVVCRHRHIYYVSFFTINSWGNFEPGIFIHEMMHVWQFQNLGSVYIPRALLAQHTPMGYDYGGTDALLKAITLDAGFAPFNLEQQADIVADYFCLREGLNPNWCRPHEANLLPLFEYFITNLRMKGVVFFRMKNIAHQHPRENTSG